MSDSTGDSTAIIIIDSTSTDAQNLAATVANSLVGDFAASMGPIAAKCDSLAGQTNNIKDSISGMTPTKTSILDQVLANGMNAGFQSSAWAMASEASEGIKSALDQCDYFKEAADKVAKYADPTKYLASLTKSATEKAEQAIGGILDKFKGDFPGLDFPEIGIGKQLSDLMSTGRTVYDKVEKGLESISEALSPIIDYGKSAINTMQTELSAAAKELGKLDKLVNCLAAVGGADYATVIDGMTEQLDCYYDKLGVFSDSSLPNFGEFDVDSYLGSIGSIAGNPSAINNIKKSINLYSKTRANAEGAIAKASDLGIKVPSSLDPAAISDSISKKKEYISQTSKTSYTVPGIPGKTEDKVVTLPEPDPVTPPPISAGDPPDPEPGKVPYSNFIKETTFEIGIGVSIYDACDPTHGKGNQYLSNGYQAFSHLSVEEPSSSPNIKYTVKIVGIQTAMQNKYADESKTDIIYTQYVLAGVRIELVNTTTNTFAFKSDIAQAMVDKWYTEDELPIPATATCAAMESAIKNAIKKIDFYESDVEPTLGW